MKFTLAWLKAHLETEASLETIADVLTRIGLEVEAIVDPAERLRDFRVAHVLQVAPHPDADKLKVAIVDDGAGQHQVVCGAPNCEAGMKGVFAPPGSYIPGADFVLKKAKIRGVESAGMLCSERELELSDEHGGIIRLPDDAVVGAPAAAALGHTDPVIEIAITPNRPDCTGVRGIARDLAAAGLGQLKPDPAATIEGEGACAQKVALNFPPEARDACPVFAGRLVEGVKNGPSPAWLRQRLEAIGLRPINALVDITNFITFDRARPLHVYDADKLSGVIEARLGRAGESFRALDGKTYEVGPEMTVIADANGVLGLGGIIGGEASGCTPETTRVFIESAYFDPIRTARTGRALQITSDARFRFERGIDPQSVLSGLDYATQLIVQICGGRASGVEIAGAVPEAARVIDFDGAQVPRLTGLDLPEAEITTPLEKLGFQLSSTDVEGRYRVQVPGWRPDVHGSADLVEEVMRIVGVDKVPTTPLPRQTGVARPVLTPAQMRARRARRVLAGRGLVEAVTWSFISHEEAVRFGGGEHALQLANPISVQQSDMRPSLLPGLVSAARRNADRGLQDSALFELGQIYRGTAPGDQITAAAGLRHLTARPRGAGRHWDSPAEPATPFDVKADALAVLMALGLAQEAVQVTREVPAWFHPGRAGALKLGPKRVLGYFGELHPGVLQDCGLTGPAVAFEVFLEALPPVRRKAGRTRPALEVTDLQPVRRDFAFVLDAEVPAGELLRAARGADKKAIDKVVLFDVFEGGELAAGEKSLAIEVTLQPREKTFTDAQIDAIAAKVVRAVEKATGARLRG